MGILCANKNVENKAKLGKQEERFQVFFYFPPPLF